MANNTRRSFLTNLGVAASAAGVTLAAGATSAHAQTPSNGRWQPARHAQDDWFDKLPGKHRMFFDTTTAAAVADAIWFSGNFYIANKSAYGLESSDLAVIICMRHGSTAFGYNDAIWAKYGALLSRQAEFTDPKTKEAPKVNYYAPTGLTTPVRGRSLETVMKMGVQFAICSQSSHGIAGMIANATGGKADDVYNEIAANLIGQARFVPAGIIAVNRAQEYGYSITGS
jgi:intracellular sulfur oxidation DsrE/DsrF family protein